MHQAWKEIAANTADFVFSISGGPNDEFKVTAFSGTEGLSQLYHFRVELVSDIQQVDFAAIVGKSCSLEISAEGATRYVHGIVRSFQRTGEGTGRAHYAAEIVPIHWLLTRRTGCRIFQEHNCPDMTVPGIVKKVIVDAGIPQDRIRLALQEKYEPREYVVQYRESEMDFISRLMEEEGIFFFFEHTATGHVMVVGDGSVAYLPTPGNSEFPYRTENGLAEEGDHFYSAQDRREVQPGTASLDDFDFLRPGLALDTSVVTDRFTSLEYRDFPGGYADKAIGTRLAQLRLEEFQSARQFVDLRGTVRNLLAGYSFTLKDHPVQTLNAEYVVVQLTHRATQPQAGEEDAQVAAETLYECHARVIPAVTPFRPPRKTPRPIVHGTQTAIVVGPSSEEVYVDKYGRVKVQFPWDREGKYDENSSCWIRVSQGWAGGKYGMMFLPRVGHEVIVDFLEGDPDKPIITGRVYNGDLSPIWNLPDRKYRSGIKSQSTKGGDGASALVFNDEKGDEYVHLHSEKDLEITAEANRADNTGGDVDSVVGGARYDDIKQNHQVSVGTDRDITVGGNNTLQVWGDCSTSVTGKFFAGCGTLYLRGNKKTVIESDSAITLKVGGNFIRIHGGGIDILGKVVNINSGGSADSASDGTFPEATEVYAADGVSHGYDVSYNAAAHDADAEQTAVADDSGGEEDESKTKKKTSWIEIELVDEAGQPWPNEAYEITTPDGKVQHGTLDGKGQAHVRVENPGECQIGFPKLDSAAWTRA